MLSDLARRNSEGKAFQSTGAEESNRLFLYVFVRVRGTFKSISFSDRKVLDGRYGIISSIR